MREIEIDELHSLIRAALDVSALSRIEMKVLGPSGLQIRIEGERCLTSIGVWPNGCCDIDYLFVSTEKGEFQHHEFGSTRDAFAPVLQEVHWALERA
jgi:hypothetical protein